MTDLVLEGDIEVILDPLAELLAVFLVFPHSGDSSRHLGVGLVHSRLESFVERRSCSFKILDTAGTTRRFLSEDT
jgi:hypothetical protein